MPQSQYQMAMPGVSQLGNVGHQIAVAMAQQRYQQGLLAQQMAMKQAELQSQMALDQQRRALLGAQVQTEGAQKGHYEAQANKLNKEQQAAGVFGDLIRDLNRVPANTQQDLMPLVLGQAATLAGQGQARLPENLAQILQMNDPRFQQMLGLGQKPMMEVGAGATAFDALNNATMFQSPRTLPPSASMVPGAGGSPIATAPTRPAGQNLGQLFGPLVNLRGQGMSSGIALEPENPTYQQVDQLIRNLLPMLGQLATNAPAIRPQVGAPNLVPQPQGTNAPAQALPIPKNQQGQPDRTALVPGQKYMTALGEATWDGQQFVK